MLNCTQKKPHKSVKYLENPLGNTLLLLNTMVFKLIMLAYHYPPVVYMLNFDKFETSSLKFKRLS